MHESTLRHTFRGCYVFGKFRLDAQKRVLWQGDEPLQLTPKSLELLLVLVQNNGRLLSKDELLQALWPDSFVEESNLTQTIFMLRKALEETPEHRYIVTEPGKGYRFVADVAQEMQGNRNGDPGPLEVVPAGDHRKRLPRQEIRYCKTDDGVSIAYSTVGTGYPLVKTANWLNHLEYEWESPLWQHWIADLSRHHRLIRYDERGNGLSAWDVADLSFAGWVRDFEAVVHAAAPQKFALLGISQGGAVAIDYAVRHPERVSHLILCNAFAQGYELYGTPEVIEARRALGTLMRLGWGKDNSNFSSLFTNAFFPENSTSKHQQWFNDLQRISTSPENAWLIMRLCETLDVRSLLPQVKVPTLVIHGERDQVQPCHAGQLLAAEIPNARFVPLNTGNHILLDEPAWHVFLEEVGSFLGW